MSAVDTVRGPDHIAIRVTAWVKAAAGGGAAGRPAAVPGSELHHRTEHLAALHLGERLLHRVQRDRLRHELVQREPALQVRLAQHGEVAFWQAVAVPGGLERAAAA